MAAFARTWTCSDTAPTSRVTLMVGLVPTCKVMPLCTKGRNPCSIASRRYGPTGKLEIKYEPAVSVTALRVNPVLICVAVTSTPGNAPPLESFTTPPTVTPCAKTPSASAKRSTTTKTTALIISPQLTPSDSCRSTPERPKLSSHEVVVAFRKLFIPDDVYD